MRWVNIFDTIHGSTIKRVEGIGFEEAGAVIYPIREGIFELYEIPQYGGEERFSGIYPSIESAKKEAESWT